MLDTEILLIDDCM